MAKGVVAVDLQKANIWKRIAAWILDAMLFALVAVGFGVVLSGALHYDSHNENLHAEYARYEAQYGVVFNISAEEYEAKTQQEKAQYNEAYQALIADEQVHYSYNMVINLSMLIVSLSILLGVLVMEFVIPLLLKNGQTVGKKAFGLGLVRPNGVRVNTMQMFVRAVLGKYTVETMIPVYVLMMFLWGTMDMTGTIVLLALGAVQLLCLCMTRDNAAIHDKLAGTVVVDIASQKIFSSTDALISYTAGVHRERADTQKS